MIETTKNALVKCTGIYMVIFALYSLATRFTLTATFMYGRINNCLYRFLLIAGCLLALWQLLLLFGRRQTIFAHSLSGLLLLFTATLFVGILSNRDYGMTDNIFGLVTFGFQLVLFYYMHHFMDGARPYRHFPHLLTRILLLCSFLWDIACLGSIGQYLLNIHYICRYADDHGTVRQGITDGRLFGLFTDPNFAAFTSLLLVLGLLYVTRESKLRIIHIFCWTSIAIQTIYMVMSNSRTVYLSVAASALFLVLFLSYRKARENETANSRASASAMIKLLLLRALFTILALIALYFAILLPVRGLAKLISPQRNLETELLRDDVNLENISNNRFTIWSAYLELYKEKPLFGFSLRSALPYATENDPDGYLAQTQYVTHNAYLSLLVETGIVGFVIMMIFLLVLFVRNVNYCRKNETPPTNTWLLFAVWILAILVFCLCFHDIFFTMNLESMLFWCGLGYLNSQALK